MEAYMASHAFKCFFFSLQQWTLLAFMVLPSTLILFRVMVSWVTMIWFLTSNLGTPSSSRAGTPSIRADSTLCVDPGKRGRPTRIQVGTQTSRGATPTSLPDSPVRNKKARKTPARHQDLPLDSVRSDNVDHFPEWTKLNRQICQNCSKIRSFTKCGKCQVSLCYNDKKKLFQIFP